MKGKRTLATNAAVILAAIASFVGIEVPIEMATELTIGVLAAINIGLRCITTTKVGES